jgi:hypothetical protein
MVEAFEGQLWAYCLGRQQAHAGYHSLSRTGAFFHYTTAERLEGILRSGHLRAYNIEHQTDYTELRLAASLLRLCLDYRFAFATNDDEAALYDAMRKEMGVLRLENFFLLSFSDDGDQESMWRLYANRGRGFSFSIPIREFAGWSDLKFITKVIYDSAQQRELLDDLIEFTAIAFRRDDPVTRQARIADYTAAFFRQVVWFGFGIKLEDYAPEREWRLAFERSSEHHKVDERGRKYIEVFGLPSRPLPISAICSGPALGTNEGLERLAGLARGVVSPAVTFHRSRFAPPI